MTERVGLGLDLALHTGCCQGAYGGAPSFWTWDLTGNSLRPETRARTRPEQFARLLMLLSEHLSEHPEITDVIIELPLSLVALARVNSNDDTVSILRGAIAIAEAVACMHRRHIWNFDPKACRKSLTGRAVFPKGTAKGHVIAAGRALGWKFVNADEADAGALWNHWRAHVNPRLAGMHDPIFRGVPAPQVKVVDNETF